MEYYDPKYNSVVLTYSDGVTEHAEMTDRQLARESPDIMACNDVIRVVVNGEILESAE